MLAEFAGSNPAEAVGFFRAKKSSACLPSEDLRHVKEPWKSQVIGKISQPFLARCLKAEFA
jgi:hypothetical protein